MLNRRDMMKMSAFIGANLAVPTGLTLLTGCAAKGVKPTVETTVDGIIASLKVADTVAKNIQAILNTVNTTLGTVVGSISSSIELVIKTYNDYEAVAEASAKQTALVLIQATIAGISVNLKALLDEVHVKNPTLITTISVGVAVINTAVTVLLNSLPAQATVAARSAVIPNADSLPILANASASALKKAWNGIIEPVHSEMVIK